MDSRKDNTMDEITYGQMVQMFQRPSQLEKIGELVKKAERKKVSKISTYYGWNAIILKAAVEAMLRTGVQSQLEGIRSAISHLQVTAEEVKQIGKRFLYVHYYHEKL